MANKYSGNFVDFEKVYFTCGFTGKVMRMKIRDKNASDHVYYRGSIAARVIAEYERFLVVKVLSHNSVSGNLTPEYITTIHKHDLYSGFITLDEGGQD